MRALPLPADVGGGCAIPCTKPASNAILGGSGKLKQKVFQMILLDILSGLIGIATAVIGTMMVAVFVVGLPVVLLWPFVLAADEIVRAGKAQGKW